MSEDPQMDQWATHLPALLACAQVTTGPILECGAGIWSTPILHAICGPRHRPLTTLESKPEWMARFVPLRTDWHRVLGVPDWSLCGVEGDFDVAFVDHGHAPRGPVVAALRGRAKYVVMHDSECHYCGYTEALSGYDWVYTHTFSPTWTTVCGMGEKPNWIEGSLFGGHWGIPVPYRG